MTKRILSLAAVLVFNVGFCFATPLQDNLEKNKQAISQLRKSVLNHSLESAMHANVQGSGFVFGEPMCIGETFCVGESDYLPNSKQK